MTIHSTIGLREKIGLCLATFMAVAKSCVEKIIRLDAQLCTWNRPPPFYNYPHPLSSFGVLSFHPLSSFGVLSFQPYSIEEQVRRETMYKYIRTAYR